MSCYPAAAGSGVVIQVTSTDPQWILPLSPDICAELVNGGTLEIVIQRA